MDYCYFISILFGLSICSLIDSTFGFYNLQGLESTRLHSVSLNHKDLRLKWVVNWNQNEVMFNIDNALIADYKWFAFGFSNRGEWNRSDLSFFAHNNGQYDPPIDTYMIDDIVYKDQNKQNWELLRIGNGSIAFRRNFDTCDSEDLRMHEGTMHVLWARGRNSLTFPFQMVTDKVMNRQCHGKCKRVIDFGGINVQLLRPDKILVPEDNLIEYIVRVENVSVPVKETTYWCHIMKLDDFIKDKLHIVQFEPVITSPSVVHHMEVFHCETGVDIQIPMYSGDCDQLPEEAKVCSKVISLWAMGASTFTYPHVAGLPVGGKNYNPYIRIEMHYNNPELETGIIDNSGLKMRLTKNLRKYDAAIMELGLEYTDKMAIPPGLVAFQLHGYCIPECTQIALPPGGIYVFGSQLHTHLTGQRVETRHFRNGEELPLLNQDLYYSTHFQEIRSLRKPTHVLPGDALVTTCYHSTHDKRNVTLGGFAISDEMCVNYIQYYPATELELCKSSISEYDLAEFFEYMKIEERQMGIKLGGPRSENYNAIHWTMPRISQLYLKYSMAGLSMQCNKSSGVRFDGYEWEGAPSVPVPIRFDEHCTKEYNDPRLHETDYCGLFDGNCMY